MIFEPLAKLVARSCQTIRQYSAIMCPKRVLFRRRLTRSRNNLFRFEPLSHISWIKINKSSTQNIAAHLTNPEIIEDLIILAPIFIYFFATFLALRVSFQHQKNEWNWKKKIIVPSCTTTFPPPKFSSFRWCVFRNDSLNPSENLSNCQSIFIVQMA